MKKLLFVSHDATRTGAPILLLNLQKAIREDYEIDFLLKDNGELKDDFLKAAPTYFAAQSPKFNRIRKLFKRVPGAATDYKISHLNWKEYDIIILNTITNGNIITLIKQYYYGPILCYVHELEMATDFFTTKEYLAEVVKHADAYLVPSQAVKEHLIKNLNIASENIAHVPYFTPPNDGAINISKKKGEFIVGGVGTSDWRKSPDLFIIIAKAFFLQKPEAKVRFIWKGAYSEGVEIKRLLYDIKQAGLQGKVLIENASIDIASFFASIHLFLLPSREDPYPLVVLEAANEFVPTICFKDAGGAPEFIENSSAGFSIPYLEINSFVEKIIYYYDNESIRKKDGIKAKEFLVNSHQNKLFIKQSFSKALEKLIH